MSKILEPFGRPTPDMSMKDTIKLAAKNGATVGGACFVIGVVLACLVTGRAP